METIEYITMDGSGLPSAAALISDEQKTYNPLLDDEASGLRLEDMLFRAGLDNYATLIVVDHGITTPREFGELEPSDIKLFCKVARDRILFRKLLANLVRLKS